MGRKWAIPPRTGRWLLVACGLLGLLAAEPTLAQPAAHLPGELADEPVYDLLVLRENAGELRLVPLDLQPRQPLSRGADEELLVVRLLDRPTQQYQVAWADIDRVQLYEETLLATAAEEARQERFDSAWTCFERVRASNATFPGLLAGELSALYLEAGYWHQQGQSDRALGLLHEIHRRAAEYPRVAEAYGAVVDRLVQAHLERENLAAVRGLLNELAERFPAHPVLQSYEDLLSARAADSVAAAEAALAAGEWRAAWEAVGEALAWRPRDAAALALHRRLAAEYPVVRVGVTQRYATDAVQSWSAERVSWLLDRRWCEPSGDPAVPSTNVGPGLATLELQETGVRLRLTPEAEFQPDELFRWLLAPPAETEPVWRSLVTSCEIAGPAEFLLQLRGPVEEFAALLTRPLRADGLAALPLPGPYAAQETLAAESVFRYSGRNPRPPGQVAEIVERPLQPDEIGRALQRGDVDLVDRVPLSELARLRALPEATLIAYAQPTRYVLAFAPRFAKGSTAPLHRLLAAGAALGRPALVDAAWGADAPRPIEACLTSGSPLPPEDGLTALDIARLWAFEQRSRTGRGLAAPTVRLAYAASANAAALVQRLSEVWGEQLPGLNVQLAPLAGDGWPAQEESAWDACCVEFRAQDARLDAWQWFGQDGLLRGFGPDLHFACAEALAATGATDLAARLAELERLALQEAAFVPLVEWTDYAAVRRTTTIPPTPFASLYQRVASWRQAAEEAP